MKHSKLLPVLLLLLLITLLLPYSQKTSGQEFSAGAKLLGTSPFVFAEAKLWILSLELGAGLASSNSGDTEYGYETGPIDFSLAGKIYPIELMGLSPYLGYANRFSGGTYSQSRTFGGVEFDFPTQNIPLSIFGGGDYVYTIAEGASIGWHLGVKYTFSF